MHTERLKTFMFLFMNTHMMNDLCGSHYHCLSRQHFVGRCVDSEH